MKTVNELLGDVGRSVNHLDNNGLHSLQNDITELSDVLENRDGKLRNEDVAQGRHKLAVMALRLSQKTIPELTKISDDLLRLSGSEAIRNVCAPRLNWNDREIPSDFKLPAEFKDAIAGKVKSGLSRLVGR